MSGLPCPLAPVLRGEGWGEGPARERDMQRKRDRSERLLNFAREMRKESTDAEKRMWRVLRDRRLSGFKFRRQYPVAGYVVDFFCARCRFGIELDGGQHADDSCREYDE